MANPEGTPIWYELLTNDAAASTAFYEEVVGWKAGGSVLTGPMEVPGGEQIIVASDVHGVLFGVVAPGKTAKTAK